MATKPKKKFYVRMHGGGDQNLVHNFFVFKFIFYIKILPLYIVKNWICYY